MGVKTLGHCHLRWTDHHSSVTLEELVEAAGRFGFSQVDLTPHLRDPSDPHRPPMIPFDRLGEEWEAPPRAAGNGGPKVRLGVEANIVPSFKGGTLYGVHLDIGPDTPLAAPVIASHHFTVALGWPKGRDSDTCPQQDSAWMFEGYLELLEAYVAPLDISVLGHIFEYASQAPTVGQVGRLARAAKKAGVALEINLRRLLKVADPSEDTLQQKVLLLRPPYVEVLAQTEVPLYLGTDIHNSNELKHLGNIQLVAEYLISRGVRREQILGWE